MTSDTQCFTCNNGRLRVAAPANRSKEVSESVSRAGVHKTCSRGDLTQSVGVSSSDTQCKACGSRSRASVPTTNTAVAQEAAVCSGPCEHCLSWHTGQSVLCVVLELTGFNLHQCCILLSCLDFVHIDIHQFAHYTFSVTSFHLLRTQ